MTNVFSYFLTFFSILFWLFRVVVAAMESLGKAFVCTTLNLQLEIILIFASLPCILLILKRNLIGATVFLGMYVSYFGTALYNNFMGINGTQGLTISNSVSLLSSALGIILPIFVFLDILINKNRRNIKLDKKTAWYFKNEKFDRVYDERADRNQYKIK